MRLRIAVLASSRGTNLQALIDAQEKDEIPTKIAVVISDNPKALALERAQKHQIPAITVVRQDFPTRELYEQEILDLINKYSCDLICLAGFMRILSPYFIGNSQIKIINIHPSLLPSFPGLDAQQQALDYGVKFSGCTVHFVDEGMDSGPIILQAVVPVLVDDTEETLSLRILAEEHRIYPEAIKLIAEGKVEVGARIARPPLHQ
ncbi:MAG: phosphoribosylglycinamide formyltransferase [Peptococcaceae bacterium BICA1-8]|nr:MAG: phosphoribosylglycinamide formyltransferase [Peptococcaceae bacterium BICA1-8]